MARHLTDLRVQARALYAQGASVVEIAAALGKGDNTIYRWKKADEKDGLDWERLRNERRRKDPHALLARLEGIREDIVTNEKLGPGGQADALWKIQRVIKSIRDEIGDPSTILGVLEGYASWVGEQCSEDEVAVVRRTMELYLDHVKRKNR